MLTTVQFLNNFAKQCEQKLMHFENKLEKINASMVLLETRVTIPTFKYHIWTSNNHLHYIIQLNTHFQLSSLPDVIDPEITSTKEPIETENTSTEVGPVIDTEEDKEPVNLEYMRFVKMVQVGVPLQAVKLKVSMEGLDPNELDKMLKV